MDSVKQDLNLELNTDNPTVVYGHELRLTRNAKWLCIEKPYVKFHRPNYYDIGGTYIEDVPDYWFLMKTEIFGDIFLLHMFLIRKSERSYSVTFSSSSEITFDKKNTKVAYIQNCMKEYSVKREEFGNQSIDYIVTYNFTDLDVEFLKDKKLYIAVDFTATHSVGLNFINDIRSKHDFGSLLEDPFASDFCIESADNIKFNVHKLIISTQSDVFRAMLKEDTAESQNNYVKLIDVCGNDLRTMLEFIYTGTVKDLDQVDFVRALMLSDRYNLKGLRELAQYALVKQLSVDNAVDVLLIADTYDSDYLKREALKFIKNNKNSLQSATFKEIMSANIIKEICLYLMS